jgi:hypothetical protein
VFTGLLTLFLNDQVSSHAWEDSAGDCFVRGHDVVVGIQYMKYNEPERKPFAAKLDKNNTFGIDMLDRYIQYIHAAALGDWSRCNPQRPVKEEAETP